MVMPSVCSQETINHRSPFVPSFNGNVEPSLLRKSITNAFFFSSGFWGAHKPSIAKLQKESDSKLAAIKFYPASSKIGDRVEPRGLRFYPPLSNKDYFLDSRARIPKLYSTRVTSAGGTIYYLFKMAYFDEKRNSYDEKSAFRGSEYDGVFDHIDDVGPYLVGNTRSGRGIRYELEDEQEKKEEVRDRVRDDEPFWGVCHGEEIRKDDLVLQEKCAYGRMLRDQSDKGKVINAWDQYFINLKNQPYIPQKYEEFDGEWPGDELHTLYLPTRQYTLEEAMVRKIDLTIALDMPLTLKVTGGKFNKFDEGMKVRKELEYKYQNGFLHCRICNKYHIRPGGPMSIASRDTCGAFLPPVSHLHIPLLVRQANFRSGSLSMTIIVLHYPHLGSLSGNCSMKSSNWHNILKKLTIKSLKLDWSNCMNGSPNTLARSGLVG